jgi:glycosyltransferase involved in cell wall biosynthesis
MIEREMLFTVIVAVFNGQETLTQCIESFSNQIYPYKQLIIIDGASSDGTLEIIRKNENVIDVWVSEPDQGVYHAWNKALAKAKGDWICFLGADDYFWDNQVLALAAEALRETPLSNRVVYGKMALINKDDELIHTIGEPWLICAPKFKYTMSIPHPGTMHRRSLFEEHGGFDESFRIAGDYELLLRELKTNEASFIPLVMVGMRQGGLSSNIKGSLTQLSEIRRAQRKQGFTWPRLPWIFAVIRVYLRLALWKVLGEQNARKLLDIGRSMLGKPPYWTRT